MKIDVAYPPTLMWFQTCMTFCVMWNFFFLPNVWAALFCTMKVNGDQGLSRLQKGKKKSAVEAPSISS